jgi:hypothetical protein
MRTLTLLGVLAATAAIAAPSAAAKGKRDWSSATTGPAQPTLSTRTRSSALRGST